jgi:hypothetical protein
MRSSSLGQNLKFDEVQDILTLMVYSVAVLKFQSVVRIY